MYVHCVLKGVALDWEWHHEMLLGIAIYTYVLDNFIASFGVYVWGLTWYA